MKILGIESSCDETACSVVEDGKTVLSNIVASQIDEHRLYGGVVPEIASRRHAENISWVAKAALEEAGCTLEDIDAIAVTYAPGLIGALLVGVSFAKGLAMSAKKPLVPVHHIAGHIASNYISHPDLEPPYLCLVASGGHSHIVEVRDYTHYHVVGRTRDDAAGECFDKVAKILGRPYPGGPAISKAAESGNPNRYKLPIPKVDKLDFSFSGLKTAVLRSIQKELSLPITTPSHKLQEHLTAQQVADFAASFQATAIKILIQKLKKANESYPAKSILLAGGVSANRALRDELQKTFSKTHQVYFPEPGLSTDNGAMVASAAYYSIQAGEKPTNPYELDISPRSTIH